MMNQEKKFKGPAPEVTLNDGTVMPQIGFGLYELRDEVCMEAVETAIEVGYRHFDTAQHYYNEHALGHIIKRSGIPRQQFYITSKTPWNITRRSIHLEVQASLIRSGLDYFDLYLIHWPTGDVPECWEAMHEMREQGYIRSLGVSNFTIQRFEKDFFPAGLSQPTVNQIEFHPYFQQPELVDYCRERDIRIMAYSPLARSEITPPATLLDIAKNHGNSPQQVMLKWSLQRGNVILPKSRNTVRMRQNLELGDFELSPAEINAINGLDENRNVLTFRPGGFY